MDSFEEEESGTVTPSPLLLLIGAILLHFHYL